MKRSLILSFSLVVSLFACSPQDDRHSPTGAGSFESSPGDTKQAERLLTVESIASLSLSQLHQSLAGLPQEPRYGVEIFKISYQTLDPLGDELEASGVIAVPKNKEGDHALIALQHGTLTRLTDAPSLSPNQGIFEASQGYLVAVQDYIGYGKSIDREHPYLIAQAYVDSGLDMIRATREFAAKREIDVSQFFLAGYSEGGYASLAIQRAIETDEDLRAEFLSPEFSLLASAPAAGPYSLSLTAVSSLQQERVNPVYLVKVVQAYRNWYEAFDPDYASFFIPEALGVNSAQELEARINTELFNGEHTVGQLLDRISTVTRELVQSDYLDFARSLSFDDFARVIGGETDESGLMELLEANSLVADWAPQIPTRFLHCVADEVIPVAMAQTTVDVFLNADPQSPVEALIIDDPSFGHGNCPAALSPLQWFSSFL